MRSRYYISFNGGISSSEFFPSNEPKLTFVQESGEIFFRWKVDTFIIGKTNNASVFADLLLRYFDPTYFSLDIKYQISINGTENYYFIDPITSGKLNSQNSIYEANPDSDDSYRPILQYYDKKFQDREPYDLFGLSGGVWVPTLYSGVGFVNVDFATLDDTSGDVTYTTLPTGEKHGNLDSPIIGVSGNIYIILITNLSYAGIAPTMKLVDGGGVVKSNTVTISANGIYYITQTGTGVNIYLRLGKYSDATGGSFTYKFYYPIRPGLGGATVKNILTQIINGASYLNLSYTIKSTILWNDALGSDPPSSIHTYMVSNPTNDYAISAAAIWNGLWLERTDIFTTSKENKSEYSLKDIMGFLKKIRVWWFIDEDGYFRIEHEKYFRSYDPQADLTSATYINDKPETDVKIYNYDRGDSYSQINYSENNQKNEDWIAYPVNFPILETSKIVKYATFTATFGDITTDVQNVIDNPGTASSSGLMLLRTTGAAGYETILIDQSTLTPANYYLNAKLGWAWLCANYYNYFAEAKTGTINNGVAITYSGVKEYLKQQNIKFHTISKIDWKKPFTLSNGIGWLSDASYDEETGMISINVQFDPYA